MANTITCIRIVCAIFLIAFPVFSKWFYIFYTVGGVSDVLDGFIARHFGKETTLGARLDTVADIIFTAVVLIKLLSAIHISIWITVWIICIAVIKFGNIIVGFVRYRHFVSVHSVTNKICGILIFIIPLCIGKLSNTAVIILIIAVCILSTFAAIQEGYFVHIGKEIK